jgi:hypothetical protein
MSSSRRSRSKAAEPKRPQIGDYFAYRGLDDFSVRLKTGVRDGFLFGFDSEHVTKCATLEGAERLAALMNQARDLARDYRLVCNVDGPHGTRDQIAGYIARLVANALDTPIRYISPDEHTRDTLREYGRREGDLARFFAFLDAAGTPATLDDFKARAMLRRYAVEDRSVTYCDYDRSREVVRAWRRSFDANIPAADRAAKVLAELASKEPA